ncbi:cortactin-binding protein 2-like [Lineus longissimus]|uniref:cortactin-binding protein 2-like n=1 Tax=Lineus longissimus TaxID=88925 RepID=UPI002B4E3956
MASRSPRGSNRLSQSSSTSGTSFDGADRLSTNTLKRHPKMELNKNDLLRLLSYLEGELQAREVVIATLKAEKARQMLYQAKYGRFGLGDPFYSLQRDSDGTRENGFDENAVRNMYDNQLGQLENLISIQKKAQVKMREQMKNTEHKYHKLTSELEVEKKKHAQDMAQGDDVTYALGKERERLKNEIEFERNSLKKMEKDLKKSQGALDDEKTAASKHKEVAIMLIKERKRMTERFLAERRKTKILEQLLLEERQKMKNMAEGLVEESKKSIKMEAAMEKQMSDFDTEREQLKARLGHDDGYSCDLSNEVERLKQQVESLQRQLAEKRSDGPQSIEIKSSVHAPNKPVVNNAEPSLCPSPPLGMQALQAVPKQVKVYKTTPPNTPPEVRRVQVDTGSLERDGKPDSNVKRAMYQLQTKPEKPEKPENLKIDRPNTPHEVVLAPGARVNVNTAQGSGTTVFTTPSGGKISFTVGGGQPRKVSPAGRGTPPPVPPNKPVFHPVAGGKKEAIVARYGPPSVSAQNSMGTPIEVKRGTSASTPHKYGMRVGGNTLQLSSPESPNDHSKPLGMSPSASPTPGDGTVRKVSQFDSPDSLPLSDLAETDGGEPLTPDDLKQLILSITSGPSSPLAIDTPTPLSPKDVHSSPLHNLAAFGNARDLHQVLLDQDCRVNTPLKDGTTAVHIAAEAGHFDCLKLLLEFGGNINNRRDDKFTPLHAAASEGHSECLRLLLEHGAHVNKTDQSGRSPLYWSARQGHEECCQLLLEYGARLDIVNFAGWSPIHAAINGGHVPCLDQLLGYIIHTTQSAISLDNRPSQLDLLLHDVFSSSDKDGMTVAHLAAMRKTTECLEAVLHYYQVDLKKKDKYGRSVYDIASVACKEFLDRIDLTHEKLCLVCISLEESVQAYNVQPVYNIGALSITPHTPWCTLEEQLNELFTSHLTAVANGLQGAMSLNYKPRTPDSPTIPATPMFGVNMFGLSLESISSFSIGKYSWSPGAESESLPYETFCNNETRCIHVGLHGVNDGSQDSLAYEMLTPTCILQNYLRLVEQYRSVVFYGPSGAGKSYVARRIADCMKAKEEQNGNQCSIRVISLDPTMTRSDFSMSLIKEGIFQHESIQESSKYARILVLDDLNKIAISDVMIDLLTIIDNRGSKCTFCLKSGGHAAEGYYYLPQNCFIIGTMDRTRSTGLDLSIQQRFRWVHCRLDSEPVNNLLSRYLCRQVLHCHGGCLPSPDNPVHKAVEWVALMWLKLNDALGKLELPEVAFGPSLFLSCPVEVNKPKTILKWLHKLWNTAIAPVVTEAVMKSNNADSDEFSQQKVANTALYVILQRAIVPGCPLTRQEKDRYLSGFHGVNELDVQVKPSQGKIQSTQSAPTSPVKHSPIAERRLCKTWTRSKSADRTFVLRLPQKDHLQIDAMAQMWDDSPNPAKPKQTYNASKDPELFDGGSESQEKANDINSLKFKRSNTSTLPVYVERSWQNLKFDFKIGDGSTVDDNVSGVLTKDSNSNENEFGEVTKGGSSATSERVSDNLDLFVRPVLDVGKQANKVSSRSDSLEMRQNRQNNELSVNSESGGARFSLWDLHNTSQNINALSGKTSPKLSGVPGAMKSQIPKLRPVPSGPQNGPVSVPTVVVTDMSRDNSVNITREVTRSPSPGSSPSKCSRRWAGPFGGSGKVKARPPVPKRTSSVKRTTSNHS